MTDKVIQRLGDEHESALLSALLLVDRTPIESTASAPPMVIPPALFEEAEARGWHDVTFCYNETLAVTARLKNADYTRYVADLRAAADASGDRVLIAKALAIEVEFRYPADDDDLIERHLARAVALLERYDGSDIMRPHSYIMCGLAYRRAQLWALYEAMAGHAVAATSVPVPSLFEQYMASARRSALINRSAARLSLSSEAYECGDRSTAVRWWQATLAEGPPTPFGHDLWDAVYATHWDLLAALAGEPYQGRAPAVETIRTTYPTSRRLLALALLASAVRLVDSGRATEALPIALEAVSCIEKDTFGLDGLSAIHTLSMHLAAKAGPSAADTMYYADRLYYYRLRNREQLVRAAIERRRAEAMMLETEHLTKLAYTDALTGLVNRRGYDRYLRRLVDDVDADSVVGVVVIDVNLFKFVNDNYGHLVGDRVLTTLAEAIQGVAGKGDLAARIGGDEFVIILDGASEKETRKRAGRLQAAVDRIDWHAVHEDLSVSISAGWLSGPSRDIQTLIEIADTRMYVNKSKKCRQPAPTTRPMAEATPPTA